MEDRMNPIESEKPFWSVEYKSNGALYSQEYGCRAGAIDLYGASLTLPRRKRVKLFRHDGKTKTQELPYWMPMPPAPVLLKTACEIAFAEKFGPITSVRSQTRFELFQAGYEAARKETR